ncbi:MAG: hypothetical protein MPK62_09985, partial [Alphaproteobacteria bacterium]|nr:hypothetical protein [Alphaproteobacteria bacterium]
MCIRDSITTDPDGGVSATIDLPEIPRDGTFSVHVEALENEVVSPGSAPVKTELEVQVAAGGGLRRDSATSGIATGRLKLVVEDRESDQTWSVQRLLEQTPGGMLMTGGVHARPAGGGDFGAIRVSEGSRLGFGFEISNGKVTGQEFGVVFRAFESADNNPDVTAAQFADADFFAAKPVPASGIEQDLTRPVSEDEATANFRVRQGLLVASGANAGLLLANNDVIETTECRWMDLAFGSPMDDSITPAKAEFQRIRVDNNRSMIPNIQVCDDDRATLEFADLSLGRAARGTATAALPQGTAAGRFDVELRLTDQRPADKTSETPVNFNLTFGSSGAGYDDFIDGGNPTIWFGTGVDADGSLTGATRLAGGSFRRLGAAGSNEVEARFTLPAATSSIIIRMVPVRDDNAEVPISLTLSARGALPSRVTLGPDRTAQGSLEQVPLQYGVVVRSTIDAGGDFEYGEGEGLARTVSGTNYGISFSLVEKDPALSLIHI